MACGCGKKGNLPKRNVNAIKPAIQQSIVRSMGVNPPEQQKQQTTPIGMDKNIHNKQKSPENSVLCSQVGLK